MKVGDLVVPRKGPDSPADHWRNDETVGVVAEICGYADDEGAGAGVKQIWVRWSNHSDWSYEYSDGVEVISASR